MPYPEPRKNQLVSKSDFQQEEIKRESLEHPLTARDISTITPALRNNPYFAYAREIEDLIKARFPYGAINRLDVAHRLEISDEELQAMLSIFLKFKDTVRCYGSAVTLVDILQPVLFGICVSFAYYALGHLKNCYPDLSVEICHLDEHIILVIGREPDSDPEDIETWGPNALICDLWASQYYLAIDFFKHRASAENILFQILDINPQTREIIGLDPVEEHFLSGNPEVQTGPEIEIFTRILANWVQADQIRWSIPLKIACTTPMLNFNMDSEKVKSCLSRISNFGNWSFNQNTTTAWCECRNEKQAQRIEKALNASKALYATLTKRIDTGIVAVKCEQIEFNKIQQIAEAMSFKSQEHYVRESYQNS